MKHKSRRYNAANETNKEFYIRRTNEMKKVIESEQWKKWQRSGGKNTKTQIVDFLVNRCFLRCEIVDIHEILPIKNFKVIDKPWNSVFVDQKRAAN